MYERDLRIHFKLRLIKHDLSKIPAHGPGYIARLIELGFEKLECKVNFHFKVITDLDGLSEVVK